MRRMVWMVLLAGACAGGEGETRKPSTTPEGEVQSTGAGVTPEQNDAIETLFRRKAQELQTCWSDEYEKNPSPELRKLEGNLTIGLTVTPSGKPRDVKILKSSLGNQPIESCVQSTVAAWTFPEVSAECPYLRTVHLGAQF